MANFERIVDLEPDLPHVGEQGAVRERWGMFRTIRRRVAASSWLHHTYAIDWLMMLLVWGAGALVSTIEPPCPSFSPSDPSISLPYRAVEIFPGGLVPLLYLLVPCILTLCVVGGRMLASKEDTVVYVPFHDLHNALLSILQAVTLSMLVTASIKNGAGRLRPDFIDRLRLELGYSGDMPASAVVDLACRSRNHVVIEGRRSFPSGHASMTFAGWTTLGLYAAARLRARYGGRPPIHVLATLLVFTGFFPIVVAMSRVIDHRHHTTDVVVGSIIGLVSGLIGFSLQHTFSSSYPKLRTTKDVDGSLSYSPSSRLSSD